MMRWYYVILSWGNEAMKHTSRHLHAVRSFLIRVRGCSVTGRLALPLHGDGNVTVLQVPTRNINYSHSVICRDTKENTNFTMPMLIPQYSMWLSVIMWILMVVPDNTVQTTDLLVGAHSLIIECHLLLKRSPTLLCGEMSGRVFGSHHHWALL